MPTYFNTASAAKHMNVSPDKIRDAINDGRLRAKRTHDSPRAPFLTTDEWLDEWFANELPDA